MINDALQLAKAAITAPAAGWRACVVLILGFHISWSCGLIPGMDGFALAQDQQEAEERLNDRLDSAESTLNGRLDDIEDKQELALRLALAAEICRIYGLRNAAEEDSLRNQLTRSLVEKQDEYERINEGRRYLLVECP